VEGNHTYLALSIIICSGYGTIETASTTPAMISGIEEEESRYNSSRSRLIATVMVSLAVIVVIACVFTPSKSLSTNNVDLIHGTGRYQYSYRTMRT